MTRVLAILVGLLAACGASSDGAYCDDQSPCGGDDVCAHTHECLPADQIHSVTIRWTIGGAPASATTCAGIEHLDVGYERSDDPTDRIVFSPVACAEGAFPNDKWPLRYDLAYVSAISAGNQTADRATIPPDANADVTVDLAHP